MTKQGLSVEQVKKIYEEFIAEFNGNFDVLPFIRERQEDIYGEENSAERTGVTIQGAYHPARRFITLAASNLDNEKAARTTIRHELLGHYGLNTFTPIEKMGVLSKVLETQQEKSLKHVWNKVNKFYPERNELERAEEVFAYVAEEERSFIGQAWDNVRSTLQKALRKAGLSKKPLTISELRVEAQAIAEGIRKGERKQQTFPSADDKQFRKETTMKHSNKKPFHEIVAENLIKQLKEGTAPWQKPWTPGQASFMPFNPVSGKRYKGINAIHLMGQGKADPRWLTYKQASGLGAQVRKGEKATTVQYWKFTEERIKRDEETGKPIINPETKEPEKEIVELERPKLFTASVFNASQIDGLPELEQPKVNSWEANQRAEKILNSSGANINESELDRAFYRSSTDSIHLPKRELFDDSSKFYATALHELGHWTGHKSRLDRDLAHPFGSEGYAKEELVAEISSMILGDDIGIGHDPGQHAAYVDSWVSILKNDPLEIFRAAASAEKVKDYVLSLEKTLSQDQIIEQLEKNHDLAVEGYSALESYFNYRDIAKLHHFEPVIRESSTGESDYEIAYMDGNKEIPILTQLSGGDGKAVTYFNGERVKDLFFSSDRDTQLDAMIEAFTMYERQEREIRESISAKVESNESTFKVVTHDEKILVDNIESLSVASDIKDSINVLALALNSVESGKLHPEEFNELAELNNTLPIENVQNWTGEVVLKSDDENIAVTLKQIDAVSVVHSTHESEEEAALAASKLKAIKQQSEIFKGGQEMKEQQQKREEVKANFAKENTDKSNRVFLNVPYKEKEEAKNLGAKWDRQARQWYIRSSMKQEPFSKWLDAENNKQSIPVESKPAPEKHSEKLYLAVPFKDKDNAKKAGAKWDSTASSWYADASSDMSVLKKYLPDNRAVQQLPKQTPEQEFAEALKENIHAIVDGDHPIMDGKKHRIKVEGDKAGEKSGFYVAHLDGRPAGVMMNNRVGEKINWKAQGQKLSQEERAKLNAEAALKKAKRAEEQSKHFDKVSVALTELYTLSQPATNEAAYLKEKGVDADSLRIVPSDPSVIPESSIVKIGRNFKESKQIREKNPEAIVFTSGELLVPAHDKDNKLWQLQAIQPNGSKRFASGGKKESSFFVVSGNMEALKTAPAIIISEGYATAKSMSYASGLPTVAAFDSGNLKKVAEIMREVFPDKPIIIGGDDDRLSAEKHPQKVNVGRVKAKEAAEAVNGAAIFPVFAPGEAETGLSDFNDLQQKSLLGVEALNRQVKAAIKKTIERQKEIKQKQENVVELKQQSIEPKKRVISR
ncbi:zincin-like metallopeptidase domain-containing protein [Pseudoalteromonas sp. SSM20]|uniref:zincin-like metallopeptidase domain-containing protein n=1 Tax=Pseudoalteromonas sp. SSM20 TaxID=3139394 RepID=UPI003BAD66E0